MEACIYARKNWGYHVAKADEYVIPLVKLLETVDARYLFDGQYFLCALNDWVCHYLHLQVPPSHPF